jgi:hypothetical protein
MINPAFSGVAPSVVNSILPPSGRHATSHCGNDTHEKGVADPLIGDALKAYTQTRVKRT